MRTYDLAPIPFSKSPVAYAICIIRDVTGEMLRIVTNVFEPRKLPVPDSPHSRQLSNAPVMDDTTENWPVPTVYEDEFAHVKYSHHVLPLPVFEDEKPVAPLDINRTLEGALVEVHFLIQHWHLGGYDTFQAKADGINILKHSASVPAKHHLDSETNGLRPPHKKSETALEATSSKG
ncbi:hypothetical protein DFJ58DRAFT_729134 [Suillus subalutaceus]|uniref:uncharacterized protein n=1 Tax=Suillus subalutaceus TaxID=48586 RepID=UPI001B86EE77|nr:uncharacterized protein DFJ58DRAFT_729134 [Suillus subalutaceus]KAG1850843.1 hypothetical protein DFJ58DRAFT_729134 [Suillus subalutaceus]